MTSYFRVADHARSQDVSFDNSKRFRDALHDCNTSCVKLIDHPLWRDTDCTDEQCSLILNNHVSQLWQLPLGVIVL